MTLLEILDFDPSALDAADELAAAERLREILEGGAHISIRTYTSDYGDGTRYAVRVARVSNVSGDATYPAALDFDNVIDARSAADRLRANAQIGSR